MLLRTLTDADVEFFVVGGLAGIAYGSARFTFDVDVVYRRHPENILKLVAALNSLSPYLRGAPPGLPFKWDERTVQRGLNFTLITTAGPIDLLGEIAGGGSWEAVLPHTEDVTLFGVAVRCIDLEWLIRTKRAAGRPKDLEALAELEALFEEREERQM